MRSSSPRRVGVTVKEVRNVGGEIELTFFSSPSLLLLFLPVLLQTASNLLPKPGPPGNQHPQDSGTAVGKMSLHMMPDRRRKYLGRA